MATKRRQLRDGILSIFDRYGVLFTIQQEIGAEEVITDLAISILAKKPRKKPQPRQQNREMYHLAQAIGEVCRMGFKINEGRLFAEAKRLAQATEPKPTPQLVRDHYGDGKTWYTDDWRGRDEKKPPTPGQIRSTWLQLAGGPQQAERIVIQ